MREPSLRDLDLKEVYDSEQHDLVRDLLVPLLQHSIEYKRGVGYFTSGWLSVAAEGLEDLAIRGGHAHYVVSPELSEEDWKAIVQGEEAKRDPTLWKIIEDGVQSIAEALALEKLKALSWLVMKNHLNFSLAFPREYKAAGMYHDKVGVCTDSHGNKIAFHGSFNDTKRGTLNGEA